MGNDSGTLRDLLSGFSTMQQQLGLLPGSSQSVGLPFPVTPLIPVKPPGQFAVEATSQLSAMSPAGVAGAYAQQFQQRMGQIESQYLSPYAAQAIAGVQGQTQFSQFPSPIYQTAPSMGIYRPQLSPPPPPAPIRPFSMLPSPFNMLSPSLPPLQFNNPMQENYYQRAQQDNAMFSATMAGIPMAAYGAGVGMSALGGRALGGMMGGGAGRLGGLIGGAALGLAAIGPAMEWGAGAMLQPAISTRLMGQQLEGITRQTVVGGGQLSPLGQGLNTRSAVQLANRMQRDVQRGETGGFNVQDMLGLTQQAAQGGFLDMAQSGEQIAQQMRNVAKGLKTFMRIAQEPDVRAAMSQMAQMRNMGLSVPETLVAERNAQQFARMAGVSRQALEGGAQLPGAMTFQQLGMSGGLGYQVGGAAAGMARAGVAGGAFSPGQLAMAGGLSGVTQSLTEITGAGLGVNFPLLAMLKRNAQGQLAIDQNRANQVMSGQLNLSQQSTLAMENVSKLGGEKVIQELGTRLNELRDELGRTLGPQGATMLAFRQAANLMSQIPGLTSGSAFRMLGVDPQRARTLELQAGSSATWRNMAQQHEVNIREFRMEELARRDRVRDAGTLGASIGRAWDRFSFTGGAFDAARESISSWFTDRSEDEAAAELGGTAIRSDPFGPRSEAMERRLGQFTRGGGYARWAERNQGAMLRGTGRGAVPTAGETAGALYNFGRGAAVALGGPLGWALGGLSLSATGPEASLAVQSARAVGGFRGALAENLPSIATIYSRLDPESAQQNQAFAEDSAKLTAMLAAGNRQGAQQEIEIQKSVIRQARELQRAVGGGGREVDPANLFSVATAAASDLLATKSSWFKALDKGTATFEVKKAITQKWIEAGYKPAVARQMAEKLLPKMMPTIMKDVQRTGNADVQAALAKIEENGIPGNIAGKDLNEVRENLAAMEEKAQKDLGFSDWGWTRAGTKEAWSAFSELTATQSEDEMLLLSSQALQRSTEADDIKKGRFIQDKLRERIGSDKFIELKAKTNTKLNEAQTEGLQRVGRVLGTRRTGANQQATMRRAIEGVQGRRTASEVLAGAAALKEEGFGSAMGGYTGTTASAVAAMRDLSGDKLEELKRTHPAIAKLVEAYKADTSKGTELAGKFNEAMRGVGARRRSVMGDKGGGGAAEQREREMMGREEDIRQALQGGRTDEAFAMAIPVLHKAAEKLDRSAENLARVAEANTLVNKTPRIGEVNSSWFPKL